MTDKERIKEILDAAFEDVFQGLFAEIIEKPGESREIQLTQIDVLARAKERIDARLDYAAPAGSE